MEKERRRVLRRWRIHRANRAFPPPPLPIPALTAAFLKESDIATIDIVAESPGILGQILVSRRGCSRLQFGR